MTHPIRTRFSKDIVAEIILPDKQTGNIIIFLSGAPSLPSKPEVLKFYKSKGYTCFLPRMRGTWESSGEFLKKSPHLDVFDIVDEVTSEKFTGIVDSYTSTVVKLKVKKIYVIGASFGGAGALLVSEHKKIKKVIALSPVVDWSIESSLEPFDFLYNFTKFAFGGSYRGKKTSWMKLKENKIYSPIKNTKKLVGKKILILHAKDDDIVPFEPSIMLANEIGARIKIYKNGGHFGLGEAKKTKYYKEIEAFIK